MASISSQFVRGVGFSNGWAEFALKKPPPLLPSSLIHSWEATGPRAMFCVAALQRGGDLGGVPRLGHALPHEDDRADDRDRQQQVEDAAGQVDPVVAQRLGALPRQPADERDGHRHAGGGRREVADGEHRGLDQVRRAALARVVLPVGVGLEAHGRVEREVRGHRRDAALVEGEDVLDAQHQVAGRDGDRGHHQDGDRVALPVLLARSRRCRRGGRSRARPGAGRGSGGSARPPSPGGCSGRGRA